MRQSTCSRRASAETVVPSSARASAAQTTARRVSRARDAASGCFSVTVRTGRAGFWQCQTCLLAHEHPAVSERRVVQLLLTPATETLPRGE